MQDFRWSQKGEVDFVWKDHYVHTLRELVNEMCWVWEVVLLVYLCASGSGTFLVGVWSSGGRQSGKWGKVKDKNPKVWGFINAAAQGATFFEKSPKTSNQGLLSSWVVFVSNPRRDFSSEGQNKSDLPQSCCIVGISWGEIKIRYMMCC